MESNHENIDFLLGDQPEKFVITRKGICSHPGQIPKFRNNIISFIKRKNYLNIVKKYFFQREKKKNIFKIEPVPIFYPEKRLILLWNAKAGCTFAIKWMFSQMGLLQEAVKYHNWVHKYRRDIYYASKQHQIGIELFHKEPASFNTIKIVANPFKRAVRSYIQACIHEYEDAKLTEYLQREINPYNRFSFREFANYLTSIDVKRCNVHHKTQTSEAERKGYFNSIYIVKLEESMKEIPLLEKIFNLVKVDIQKLRNSPHHRPKYQTSEFVGDTVMNEIFKVRKPTIPDYKQFYDTEIKAIIADVYKEDFKQYNYEDDFDLLAIG